MSPVVNTPVPVGLLPQEPVPQTQSVPFEEEPQPEYPWHQVTNPIGDPEPDQQVEEFIAVADPEVDHDYVKEEAKIKEEGSDEQVGQLPVIVDVKTLAEDPFG